MTTPTPPELKRRAIDAYMSRDDPNFDGALDDIYAAGIAAARDTRIAELEAEVAAARKVVEWTRDRWRSGTIGALLDEYDAAQSPTPPAPEAREKPPEAEEPEIVRGLRDVAEAPASEHARVSYGSDAARELLAFIDSRKAAVSDLEIRVGATKEWRQLCFDARAERDGLREENAKLGASATALGDQWRSAAEELSALKARPVVDVASARADISIVESWLRLIERDAPDVPPGGPSQHQRARDALYALTRALESLQPASAKADELTPAEHDAWWGMLDPEERKVVGAAFSRGSPMSPEERVKMTARIRARIAGEASAKADEKCPTHAPNHVLVTFSCEHCHNSSKSNMRGQDVGAHAVRYYEHHKACAELPAAPRVSEEEQERRLRDASGLIATALREPKSFLYSLDAIADGLAKVIEYLRAEREGRKAT